MQLWENLDADTTGKNRQPFAETPCLIFRRQALEEPELTDFAPARGKPRPYAEQAWRSRFREDVLLSNTRNAAGEQMGGLANQELIWRMDQ